MLFNHIEQSNFRILNSVIHNLQIIFQKIEERFLSSSNRDFLKFNNFEIDYKSFKEVFKYSFNYLELLFNSNFENLKPYQSESLTGKISQYTNSLGECIQESIENNSSNQLFVLKIVKCTLKFFEEIKLKGSLFEELFDDSNIDQEFRQHINNLKTIEKNIIELGFKDIDDLSHFFQNYNNLNLKLNEFSKKSEILENEFRVKMDSFFASKGRDFDKSVDGIILNFNKQFVEVQTPYENEIKNKISDLNSKYEESKNELLNLLGDLKNYKNILSVKTQDEISKHYFLKANSEKRMYWITTVTSIVLILISLSSVGWALSDYYHDYISITSCVGKANVDVCLKNLRILREASQSFGLTFFIMRFVFSLLLFLTVIYTSRIAIRAYNHWRHSENMHLKLVSLNPFIGNLDKEKRDEIHIGLVPDYFGKDAGVIEFQKDGFKDIPTNVANVAIKALEQAGGTFGGKSNTERNDKKPEGGTE